MTVDIMIEDPRWGAAGLDRLANPAAQATLRHLGLDLPPTRCDMRPDGYLCALTEHVFSG